MYMAKSTKELCVLSDVLYFCFCVKMICGCYDKLQWVTLIFCWGVVVYFSVQKFPRILNLFNLSTGTGAGALHIFLCMSRYIQICQLYIGEGLNNLLQSVFQMLYFVNHALQLKRTLNLRQMEKNRAEEMFHFPLLWQPLILL